MVIVDPLNRQDTVEVVLEDKGDNIYRCTYKPNMEGPHKVYITFAGAQIPKCPYVVNIAEGEFISSVKYEQNHCRGQAPRSCAMSSNFIVF